MNKLSGIYMKKSFKSKEAAQKFCDKVNKGARFYTYIPTRMGSDEPWHVVGTQK
jgi:viroplasmin and RNaseH domain-containing protein